MAVAAPSHEQTAQAHDNRTGAGVKLGYGFLVLVAVVYGVSLFVRANGVTWTWLDGWGVATFELLASVLVLARAFASPAYRRFSTALGIGMCFWSVGDFVMTHQTLGGKTPPTISTANILWAGFYPFAYVAVMMLIRQEARKLRLAHYLDGVMAALAAGALFIAFLFAATNHAAGGDVAGTAINLVYPFGDFFLFVLIMVGVALLPAGRRLRWGVMAAACVVNMGGDIAALFPGIVATRIGFVLNAGAWPASLLLISLAVWMRPPVLEEEPAEIAPSFLLPALAAASALLVVLVASVDHVNRGGMVFAAATLVTAGLRFGLSLREFRTLQEERLRELEQSATAEQESHAKLEETLRELEGAARAERESQARLQAAMQDYSAFSAKAAEGATQQSEALVHTSSTVEQVRVAAESTAERAAEVADRARSSLQVSEQGTQAVATIADAMEEIRQRVEEIADDILTLSARTQQIGDITETVKGLADRSKLLALNASIEAARAGEHGKGFSVVADEVRSLSEQSKEATVQVEKALAEIQDATVAAVGASKEGTKVVEKGLALTDQAGDVIRSLADTIREAAEAVGEIAASAQQESAGIEEIASSLSNVNEAAENLNELYRSLQELDGDTATGTVGGSADDPALASSA